MKQENELGFSPSPPGAFFVCAFKCVWLDFGLEEPLLIRRDGVPRDGTLPFLLLCCRFCSCTRDWALWADCRLLQVVFLVARCSTGRIEWFSSSLTFLHLSVPFASLCPHRSTCIWCSQVTHNSQTRDFDHPCYPPLVLCSSKRPVGLVIAKANGNKRMQPSNSIYMYIYHWDTISCAATSTDYSQLSWCFKGENMLIECAVDFQPLATHQKKFLPAYM